MKRLTFLLFLPLVLILCQCKQNQVQTESKGAAMFIQKSTIDTILSKLTKQYGDANKVRMEKGISQAAALWMEKDGTVKDFEELCIKYFINDEAKREKSFQRISANFESLFGHANMVSLDLKRAMALELGEIYDVDEIFNSYEPTSHFNDDFFANKMAFIININFPFYSLKEKEELGGKWSRLEWAYARMGDQFTARVPAEISQKVSDALAASDNYISNYNI
ncbi:MAG: hypothetical protein WCL00_02345, partial [Bacteroidota bacterium]